MNMLTYVSINLFPIVMLLVIYTNNHKKMLKTPDKRQFDILTLLILALIIVEILSYGLDGATGVGTNAALWIVRMARALMVVRVASEWLVYINCRLELNVSKSHMNRWMKGLIGINILFMLLVVTTPWTHLLFTVTEDNRYQPGKYYYLPYLVSTVLLIIGMCLIIQNCRRKISGGRRNEGYYLLGCGILALLGMILQYSFPKRSLGVACLSLIILFIYLNTQNRQITTDELTGLNNRREFDQQIVKRAEQASGSNWGMFMLDVNDFKRINDNLGHIVGDEALWETADILRRTLGKERSFLARYGGDEFAVIGEWSNEQEACAAIQVVENEVERFNKEAGKSYKLSFSIGYAMWSEVDNTEELVEKADSRMYHVKACKKSEAAKQTS